MKSILALVFSLFLIIPEQTDPVTNLSVNDIQLLVDTHNEWRADVGVGDLRWSPELAQVAAKWAKELKNNKCAFEHSKYQYGENLFMGTAGAFDAKYVVDSWGSEKEDYNYVKNKCRKVCGHYTQMVWKSTTKVGCAKITCDGMDIWVCEYDPPGNYVGQKPY